ncbi:hypothetical protein EV702DRAFT_1195286 [Suillus placidus]|uniref:Uncharacterized protein n=1 Tax=Suillus placidus TaxID=48579 RepID=A0A9P7D5I7_9AGAM|nr:hypothetical protein EV702DRAFT_1195286 [Suillus placidus]
MHSHDRQYLCCCFQVVPQAAVSLVPPSQTPPTHVQSATIITLPSQTHSAHSTQPQPRQQSTLQQSRSSMISSCPTTASHTSVALQHTSSVPTIATTIPTTTLCTPLHTPATLQHTSPAPSIAMTTTPSQLSTEGLHYGDVHALVVCDVSGNWHGVPRAAPPLNQPQSSHITNSSDTDSEDSDIDLGDDEDPGSSWIVTPAGSPPISQAQATIPLPYYYEPAVAAFNFSHAAQDYLLHIGASPRMLCRINTSLNYSILEWLTCFEEAGLTCDQGGCHAWYVIDTIPVVQKV